LSGHPSKARRATQQVRNASILDCAIRTRRRCLPVRQSFGLVGAPGSHTGSCGSHAGSYTEGFRRVHLWRGSVVTTWRVQLWRGVLSFEGTSPLLRQLASFGLCDPAWDPARGVMLRVVRAALASDLQYRTWDPACAPHPICAIRPHSGSESRPSGQRGANRGRAISAHPTPWHH
jgi:hypothetical protein